MLTLHLTRLAWIPGAALLAAFILTFWDRQATRRLAAAFYTAGMLIGFGLSAYVQIFFVWMNYHLTDGPPVGTSILVAALAFQIVPVLYALIAIALLWPGIPQEKALSLGKILHLIVLPSVWLITLIALTLGSEHGPTIGGLGSLAYPFLWFRIRESYTAPSVSRNLEPVN